MHFLQNENDLIKECLAQPNWEKKLRKGYYENNNEKGGIEMAPIKFTAIPDLY